MAKDGGWIKLYRTVFDNPLYFTQKFTDFGAWIDLLLLANHKDGYFEKRGIRFLVPRGCVGYSSRVLGKRWKWSYKKVLRFVDFLGAGDDPHIRTQKSNVTTLIIILNYDKYQINGNTEWDTKRPTSVPQVSLNKNVKNNTVVKIIEKNEKEINRNISSGERLFVDKYGTEFPKIDYGAKDDNDEPT